MRFEDYRPAGRQEVAASAVAAVALVRDPIDAEVFRAAPQSRNWARSGLCWVLAAAAHAAVIGGLAVAIEPGIAGSEGATHDALGIEVAIVSASALEARRHDTATPVTSSAQPEDQDGDNAPEATPPAHSEKPAEAEPQPMLQAKPDPSPIPTDETIIVAEKKPEEKRDIQPSEKHNSQEPVTIDNAPASAGSVSVTAAEHAPVTPKQAAAAASPGAVDRYARSIADVLAKSRPKSSVVRSKGTVKVAFAVAEDGRTAFVRVTASSGDKRLDEVALAAISSVAFPPPPPGMTLGQRTYEIPYYFR